MKTLINPTEITLKSYANEFNQWIAHGLNKDGVRIAIFLFEWTWDSLIISLQYFDYRPIVTVIKTGTKVNLGEILEKMTNEFNLTIKREEVSGQINTGHIDADTSSNCPELESDIVE